MLLISLAIFKTSLHWQFLSLVVEPLIKSAGRWAITQTLSAIGFAALGFLAYSLFVVAVLDCELKERWGWCQTGAHSSVRRYTSGVQWLQWGAIKSIYILFWAWKTVLSVSFTCPNNSKCILDLNCPYFECIVLQFIKPQLLLCYHSARQNIL